MHPTSKRRSLVLLAIGTVVGCGGSIDGPAPVVTGVAPAGVCQAQLTTTVELSGSGLAPLYTGALDNGELELPKVSLTRVADVAGVSLAAVTPVAIPDDAANPASSHVRWNHQASMVFDVSPDLQLSSGLYDVEVANSNGKTGRFPSSLLVTPPPTLVKIEADLACSEKPNTFTLTGDFFIRSASGATPTVAIGEQILSPTSMTGCRDLPGTGGFQACTQMVVALAQSLLQPSVVPVVVTNPDPVGCHSSEAVMLTLVPAPVVTSVVPDLACAAEGAVLVTVQGTGFLTVDGKTPSVNIAGATVTSTASECTPITGVREVTQTCGKLHIAIPVGTAAGRPEVVVLNPAPADCSSIPTRPITLFDRPLVLAAIPDMACAAEDAVAIKIQGAGFLTVDGTLPTVTVAGVPVVAAVTPSSCIPVPHVIEIVQLCTEVVITVPKSTAAGQPVVVVRNPSPADCSSLPSKPFMLFDRPAVVSAIPDMICTAEGAVPVTLTGTGFLTVDGVPPVVSVAGVALTPTVSECTVVDGPREVVQSCTRLQIAVPAATAAGQPVVVVKNPAPAGCSSLASTPIMLFDRPMVISAQPDLACTADGSVSIKLTGLGFLTIDGVAPTVSVAGAPLTSLASGCTPIVGPVEVAQACSELTVLVPGETAVGQPDIIVTNPLPVGCSSLPTKPLSLVDRPQIASITPDETCSADGARTIAIKGTGFLTVDGVAPVVTLGALSLPSTAVDCTPMEGPAETVMLCNQVDVTIPVNAPAGALAVSVTNPAPAACASLAGPVLTLFDRPIISKVTPGAACENAGNTAVVLSGSNFVVLDGVAPSVKVGDQVYTATASGCAVVPNTGKPTQTCTSLTVNVAPASLTPGKLPVIVTNPTGIGCASSGTAVLEITAPPQLTSVSTSTVCAGAASIVLTGSNFAEAATVTVNGVAASSVTVSANGTSAVADLSGLLNAGGPYDVTISNGASCSSTIAAAVLVVSGPKIFFYDPSVAYNGISIEGTLYGSGYTGAVQSVSIKSGSAAAIPLGFKQDASNANRVLAVIPKGTPAGTYDIELRDTTSCPATLTEGLVVTETTTVTLATPVLNPPFGWKDGSTASTVTASAAATGFVAVPRLYLNPTTPGAGTLATPLGAVAFIDKTQLTVMVPAGLPLGSYDLIVVNPDGTVGVALSAYTVMQDPPPRVEAVSPGSVQNQPGQVVNVSGSHFRTPTVTLSCVNSAGAALATSPSAAVSNASATGLTITLDGSAAGAACVIRVNNADTSYGDFSALVVTNPAQNLYPAKSGPTLASARRAPVALGGDASNAARYLHVIGGDDGNTTAFDTVETAPLSLLGVPNAFFTQRNKLKQARAFAAGVQIGRFLYVAGGQAAGVALASIERAYVLDPESRGQISNLLVDIDKTAGVGPGIWYYRVAAIMDTSDAVNPGGESLPSDPFPVRLPDLGNTKFDVYLTWKAQPGATKYRVYRSPVAGATVGTEQVIAEVAAPGTTFTDNGIAPISTDEPLAIGSLGTWQVLPATLATPREGAAMTWGMDPGDASKAYIYVLGGRQNATTALDSIEILPITLAEGGAQTPAAAFVASTTPLSAARWQLGASRATNDLSPRIPVGTTYVYALSGVAADSTLVTKAEAAPITAGGQLAAFIDLGNSLNRAGYATLVAGNFVFAFGGGNAGPDTGVVSGEICGPGVNGCGPVAKQVPPGIANWNAGQSMQVARYQMGGVLSGAYFYVVGGVTSAGTPPVVTNSTEYRLW